MRCVDTGDVRAGESGDSRASFRASTAWCEVGDCRLVVGGVGAFFRVIYYIRCVSSYYDR